ncbi:lipid-A-disaccharide synthase [bacterium]|nr:lipid-A-disaccharide synthase [bacterium]
MKKIFIITGEYSGDKHAADVVREILKVKPDVQIEAVGGKNLESTGIKLFSNHDKMSAVGLGFNIIVNHIILGKKIADYLIKEYKPDLVLLVDYGGFNLNIAKVLKRAGLKIFYYIPPQIWASRKWRIKTVKKYIDKVITIFPFETQMYKDNGIDVEFAGHPLVNQLPKLNNKREFLEKNNIDLTKKLISIFPGSRIFEIKNLLKIFLEAAKIIEKKIPNVEFVVCQAPTIKDEQIKKIIPANIKILKNCNYELLAYSDFLILASGTVALEAALYQTPMIISYKGPELFYLIYLLVRCIKRVSLPNIITNKDIIPELVQHKANPGIIAKSVMEVLTDSTKYAEIKSELASVNKLLTDKNSAKETAKILLANI